MLPKDEEGARTQVARRLMLLSRRKFQLCDAMLEKIGVGPGQVPIFMTLSHHGEMTQRELAEHVSVTPATMSGALKRLERAGMIARRADASDARVSMVRLTEKGTATSKRARELFGQADEKMLQGVSDAECEALLRCFSRMLGNLSQAMEAEKSTEETTK